ncbi:MAG: Na+/H+ antiporter subunit E [Propionibacteriaceae bacterium]|nr:Na+/H+ antiporter subunit E [Propionibacteriaceae bacterium]
MTSWLTWPFRLLFFVLRFIVDLTQSNVAVVRDVAVRPQLSDPMIVAFSTRCRTEFEVALLSITISLTPGTLVLATQTGPLGPVLMVHVMYAEDPDSAVSALERGETALLGALRREGAPA